MTGIAGGSDLGPYRVESLQRSGAGGAVFRAQEPGLERQVALVVPSSAPGSESSQRFLEDTRLLARLSHPNLLPVYEVGLADGRPFAAVRDPAGRRLDELLEEGALTPDRAVEIGADVAAALEALRAAGAEPAQLTPSSVILAGDRGLEHVYLSPLDAVVDASAGTDVLRRLDVYPDTSVRDLAALLETMSASGNRAGPAIDPDAYDSPSALIEAMRAAAAPAEPAAPPRSRRPVALMVGALALMLVVAGAAILFFRGDDDETAASTPATASPSKPAGRLVATIPLGTDPGSIAVGPDAIWVGTADGTVLRVDPRTNEVVGAPIRFTPVRKVDNVTVRFGAGSLWALDGSGGTVARIDPDTARVTGRLRLGGMLHGATVDADSLWVSRAPPGKGWRQAGELVRVDTETFRPVGRPIRIGPGAFDVEAADGFVWTLNASDGTISRYDVDQGSVRTFIASAQPIGAALRKGVLWIADPVDGTVTPLETRGPKLPEAVVRGSRVPFAAAATADAVWVVAVHENTPTASGYLYRIDPDARRLVGRPVRLGPDVGWPSAGFGSIWVQSRGRNALLRIAPSTPPPALRPVPPAATDPRVLQAGPLASGSWRAGDFGAPLSFGIDRDGWVSLGPQDDLLYFVRFDSPDTNLLLATPKQLFTATGGVRRLTDPEQVVTALESHPHVRIVARERVRVGGIPAQRLTLAVEPHEGYPDFCTSACVPLFPVKRSTVTVESDSNWRVSIMKVGGRIVSVTESAPRGTRGFSETEDLLRTMRFDAQA